MKEIETKIYGINPGKIRQQLIALNAKQIWKGILQNTYFTSSDIKKRGLSVRIRDNGEKCVFTVKGPRRIVNKHKVQEEHETVVDGKAMTAQLLLMGCAVRAYIEMQREYYSLYDCSVEICKLPRVPEYLEIEGNPKDINKVAAALGFTPKDFDNRSPREKFRIPKSLKTWKF